ncbi:MAG: alkylation response protein AidB-like acyl-CoA dehydrogenase [Gammaproteobacteria bacterium]|jgi:alkylation response protein AidB-like acyl-CoA dehydrogenase
MASQVAEQLNSNPATLLAECVQRAQDLRPIIESATGDIDAQRELPASVLDAMHGQELFRLTLPHELGGGAIPPYVLAQVTEAIAMADASAAWCLGQASGCAMSSAFMEPAFARQVFGPSNAALAWGAGAVGKAVATDGGFRITGRWGFASGGKHATWLGAHCKVFEADGSPRLNASGKQAERTALFPRNEITTFDDWYVMGLRGTRSEGYQIDDVYVEDGLTLDREASDERRLPDTLYKFSTTMVYAGCFSGVALGIARSMLDDLFKLALHKTPRGTSPMRDSQVNQVRFAELEARWSAARAFQQLALSDAWEEMDRTQGLEMKTRARVRLATTHAINEATDISEKVYRMAGATAIFVSQPFEQRFRDVHGVSQQVQGRFTNYETVGKMMLGLDVDTLFL